MEGKKITLVDIASFVKLFGVGIEPNEGRKHRWLLRLHMLIQLICQVRACCVSTEGQNCACKVRCHLDALLNGLIQESLHSGMRGARALDQEAVCYICETRSLLP